MAAAESRFQRLHGLFDAALELPESAWGEFASASCGDDPDLKEDLLRLLERQRGAALLEDRPILSELGSTLCQAIPAVVAEGSMIGPYRVVEWLGDGGMGRVYRAIRDGDDVQQEVAVKLIRGELLNPALLGRFSTERRLLSTLNHPGICRFLDSGVAQQGVPYVVMELVRGQPLNDYCDAQRSTIRQRLQLLRRVIAAVAHAHHQLIVHRDIKSNNVLVDASGEPKLLDFGIAKSLAAAQALQRTATAERFLTPASAAPEQLRGEPVGVGCDIYAIGLMAYELLCGRQPFDLEGLRAGEVERLLLQVPPPPMSRRVDAHADAVAAKRGLRNAAALSRALAGDLDAIVATCLRKAAHERYAAVEQLDADLACVIDGLPISTRRSERGYRLRKFVARNKIVLGAAAMVFASLVAALAITLIQARSLAEQRNRAIAERDRAQQAIELLQSAFLAADPARVAGVDVRVRHVLDSAKPGLERLRASQPATYASLAATLAQVELSLGEDASAAQLVNMALQAVPPWVMDRDVRRRLLLIAARAFNAIGDATAAETVLEEARTLVSPNDPDWNVAMGQWLISQRRQDEALRLLRPAVEATRARVAQDELAMEAQWQLARALEYAGQADAAVEVMDELIEALASALPPDHPRLVLTRMQRLLSLRVAKRYDEALADGERILTQVRASYGDDSTMAALAQARLGTAYFDVDRTEAAIVAYRASLEGFRARLGMTHSRTIKVALNLAETLGMTGEDDAAADALFQESIAAVDQRFGAASNIAAYFRVTFAGFLLSRERFVDAAALLTDAAARQGFTAALEGTRGPALQRLTEAARGLGCEAAATPDSDTCARIAATVAELSGRQGE